MAAACFTAFSILSNFVPKRHFPAPRCGVLPSRRGASISFPPNPTPKEKGNKGQREREKTTPNAGKVPPTLHPVLNTALSRPLPYKKSCGGSWPPLLLSFHLGPLLPGALFSSLLSCLIPRWDGDHLLHLRFLKKGQHRFGCSFIPEEQGHSGRPGMLQPAQITHVLPQILDLGPPGRAVHEQVVMT